MVVLGSIAVVGVIVDTTLSGLLVAAALLALAAWDVNHRRANRVVDRASPEFCHILDVLVPMLVAVVTLTAVAKAHFPREDGLDHARTAISQGVDHADRE